MTYDRLDQQFLYVQGFALIFPSAKVGDIAQVEYMCPTCKKTFYVGKTELQGQRRSYLSGANRPTI